MRERHIEKVSELACGFQCSTHQIGWRRQCLGWRRFYHVQLTESRCRIHNSACLHSSLIEQAEEQGQELKIRQHDLMGTCGLSAQVPAGQFRFMSTASPQTNQIAWCELSKTIHVCVQSKLCFTFTGTVYRKSWFFPCCWCSLMNILQTLKACCVTGRYAVGIILHKDERLSTKNLSLMRYCVHLSVCKGSRFKRMTWDTQHHHI